jgi:hypothetical protein
MRFMKSHWMRASLLAVMLSLVVVPAAWSVIQPDPSNGPPDPNYTYMAVVAGKKSVVAAVGTYSVPSKADPTVVTNHKAPSYPLTPRPTLTVSRGQALTLRLKAPSGYITWRAARVSGGIEHVSTQGEAEVRSATKRSWRVTLPKNLSRKVTVLGFTVQYLNAYNSYEVGIKVR